MPDDLSRVHASSTPEALPPEGMVYIAAGLYTPLLQDGSQRGPVTVGV